ncbi:MAG: hypothetical protein DRJ26_02180, partial [Candidatus Methanomethylicota archaeon]
GMRVLENMVNCIGHCTSCGHLCIERQCKYGKYSFAENIVAVYEIEPPENLPELIDNPYNLLPKKLPKADLVLATGLHNDLYMELPNLLRISDISALIIFREDPKNAPPGIVKYIEEECEEYGIEFEAPKPSCTLRPKSELKVISKFIREFRIGKPLVELELIERANIRKITAVKLYTSAPCGTTWYVARQMLDYTIKSFSEDHLRKMYDYIALHHHAAPCIGSMAYDHELGDTILHWGSYIEREAYLRALGLDRELRDTIKERLMKKFPATRC